MSPIDLSQNAADVVAAAVDASPEDRAAALTEEQAGKGRATVLAALQPTPPPAPTDTVRLSGVEAMTVSDGISRVELTPKDGQVDVERRHLGAVLAHFPDARVVEDASQPSG